MWEINGTFFEKFTSAINKHLNRARREKKMLPAKPCCTHWCEARGAAGVGGATTRTNSKMQINGERRIVGSVGFRWWELKDTDLFFSDNHTPQSGPGLGIFSIIFALFFCCSFAAHVWLFAIGSWFLTLHLFQLKRPFSACLFSYSLPQDPSTKSQPVKSKAPAFLSHRCFPG